MFISGKLAAPDVRSTIRRERLTRVVRQTPPGGVCLLVAAPGYGKRVLLGQATSGSPRAWVRLDRRDVHPSRFWSLLLAALPPSALGDDHATTGAPPGARRAAAAVGDDVIVRLSTLEPTWVVLENVDVEDHELWLGDLKYLLAYLPPQVRVGITMTGGGERLVAEARLHGLCVEICQATLAFTRDESTRLLHERAAARVDASVLHDLTWGWPAAVVLAAQRARLFPGDDVIAWMRDQGPKALHGPRLDALDAESRGFLLDTAELTRLHAGLCDAIRRGADGAHCLERRVRRGYLRAVGDGTWAERDPLLTLLLKGRALGRPGAAERHARAADWFGRHGDPDRQLHHLFEAGDYPQAAAHFATRIDHYLETGRGSEALRWYERLPDGGSNDRGLLRIAWAAALSRDLASATTAAARLEHLLYADALAATDPEVGARGTREAQAAELAVLTAYLAFFRGDLLRMATDASRATEAFGGKVQRNSSAAAPLLEAWARLWLGETDAPRRILDRLRALPMPIELIGEVLFLGAVAELAVNDGRIHEALAAVRRAERWLAAHPDVPEGVHGLWLRPALAAALLSQGDVPGARAQVDADSMRRWAEDNLVLRVWSLTLLARIHQAEGQPRPALWRLAEARHLVLGEAPNGGLLRLVDAAEIRLRLTTGDGLRASRLLQSLPPGNDRALLRARLALSRGSSHAVRLAGAVDATQPRHIAERELLLACAASSVQPTAAERHLLTLGDIASEYGLLVTLLDAPPTVITLAKRAATRWGHDGLAALVTVAQRAWLGLEHHPRPQPSVQGSSVLSPGDRELLALLPGRDRNSDMADRLSISVNTVKTRLKRLYRKLGVSDRDAAVARGRDLGLLT